MISLVIGHLHLLMEQIEVFTEFLVVHFYIKVHPNLYNE